MRLRTRHMHLKATGTRMLPTGQPTSHGAAPARLSPLSLGTHAGHSCDRAPTAAAVGLAMRWRHFCPTQPQAAYLEQPFCPFALDDFHHRVKWAPVIVLLRVTRRSDLASQIHEKAQPNPRAHARSQQQQQQHEADSNSNSTTPTPRPPRHPPMFSRPAARPWQAAGSSCLRGCYRLPVHRDVRSHVRRHCHSRRGLRVSARRGFLLTPPLCGPPMFVDRAAASSLAQPARKSSAAGESPRNQAGFAVC